VGAPGAVRWGALALAAALLTALPARAQFAHVPTPLVAGTPRTSEAETEKTYRRDAARRIYESFPMHIYRGKMPALTYAIAITETDVGADGVVTDVRLTREPASAKEVGPWVVALIRRVGQMPPLAKMAQVTYTETWLVDKSGKFQLHTLSEGQRGE
jgi:hypothetical protein